jgi:ABC-type transporter Mla subunit MlaD
MDPAYFSAFAALAGSAIGGLTSLGASWLTQHVQFRAQQLARDLRRREDLYKDFIEEASKSYADAFARQTADLSTLVRLYALVNRMRIRSSPQIVDLADRVTRVITETYERLNKTLRDVREIVKSGALDPLRDFSNACREELRLHGNAELRSAGRGR